MLRDLKTNYDVSVSLVPAVRTATTNGTGVDLAKHSGASVIFAVGANGVTFSGTDKITLSLQESDDNITFTAVATDDQLGATVVLDANAKANTNYLIGYVGNKRYLRAVITHAGTHGTGTAIGAIVLRGYPRFGHSAVV